MARPKANAPFGSKMSNKKNITWDRRERCTDKLITMVQSSCLPNGYRVAYLTKANIDSFKSHMQKCLWWWELVKMNYPGTPTQKDIILNGLVKGISEIWPKEVMGLNIGR